MNTGYHTQLVLHENPSGESPEQVSIGKTVYNVVKMPEGVIREPSGAWMGFCVQGKPRLARLAMAGEIIMSEEYQEHLKGYFQPAQEEPQEEPTEEHLVTIGPGGEVRFIASDNLLPLKSALGQGKTRRASHVEPNDADQWEADLSPVGGPVLGPFTKRSEALAAETEWIKKHVLGG